jgi:nitrate/TMAO reductase-like tetraheme cytochrome c subunit
MIDPNQPMTVRQQVWTQFAAAAATGMYAEHIGENESYAEPVWKRAEHFADQMTERWKAMRDADERACELAHLQELEEQERSTRERREIEAAQRDRIKRAEDHAAIAKLKEKQKRKRKAA